MRKLNKIKILAVATSGACIILAIIPFLISVKADTPVSILSLSLSGVGTIITIATFIVALLFYEKFSLDAKILDKQADAVLELIGFLKGKTFLASTPKFTYIIRPDINSLLNSKSMPFYKNDCNKIVLISNHDYELFINSLMKLSSSYWIPTEIKQKLEFLEFKATSDSTFSPEEVIRLGFGTTSGKDLRWTFPETSFDLFINNLIELVEELENWIKNRSSIPLELLSVTNKSV
jgi:hypothetical protein